MQDPLLWLGAVLVNVLVLPEGRKLLAIGKSQASAAGTLHARRIGSHSVCSKADSPIKSLVAVDRKWATHKDM